MFVLHNDKVLKIPGVKHRYISEEELDDWWISSASAQCEYWIEKNVISPLGGEEWYPFDSEQTLREALERQIRLESEALQTSIANLIKWKFSTD